jgi:hypothetical protein
MTDGVLPRRGRFQAQVPSQIFRPREDLDMLFVLVDNLNGAIKTAWLVASVDFDKLHGRATTRGNFRFSASTKEGTRGQ